MPTITDKSRPDLSPYLIHFTSGNDDEAFESLVSILETKTIQQSDYKCYGEHISCYTETPIQSIQTAGGFVNWTNYTNYSQFGILLRKEDLYRLDTRPVFNCAEKFHEDFPKHLKWRCKIFEPKFTDKSTDFAWEREWRKIGDLDLSDINYEVIVPNENWGNKLSSAAKEKGFQILNHCTNDELSNTCYEDCIERFCEPCETCEYPDPQPCLICIEQNESS